ncbi:hypothetical protein MEL_087 [Melbournevirus]|uniref:hypothetical protein n=1 Tax=Melbournevirus TaxID=1560514 RepID=UPI00051F53F5|nr:hypothetical protein MEL_087 [Melbournevirus]AIT54700.1 hypothetical protein MEL_087 [Melbournevirus]
MYVCLVSSGTGRFFVVKFHGPLEELKKRLNEREVLLASKKLKQKDMDRAISRIFEAFYEGNYQRLSEFEFLEETRGDAVPRFLQAVDGVREACHIKKAMDAIDNDIQTLEEKQRILRQKKKILKEELENMPCQKNSL